MFRLQTSASGEITMSVRVKAGPKKSRSKLPPGASQSQVSAGAAVPPAPSDGSIAPQTAPGHRFGLDVALCFILAVVTLAVYFRATQNPFVNFDDPSYVVENPNIQHGLTKATFIWAFMNRYEMNWHPLTWLSHALDYQIFGLYPRRPRPERYLLTAFLFAAALAAKPMVVTLPLLLLLIDFWPLGRVQGVTSPSAAFPVRQFSFLWLAVEKIPLLALSAA